MKRANTMSTITVELTIKVKTKFTSSNVEKTNEKTNGFISRMSETFTEGEPQTETRTTDNEAGRQDQTKQGRGGKKASGGQQTRKERTPGKAAEAGGRMQHKDQIHQLYAPRCGKTHIQLGGCWAAFSNRRRRFAADFCSVLFSAMASRGPTSENSDMENANKPASSWPLKQGPKKWSKHGCDKGTLTVAQTGPEQEILSLPGTAKKADACSFSGVLRGFWITRGRTEGEYLSAGARGT